MLDTFYELIHDKFVSFNNSKKASLRLRVTELRYKNGMKWYEMVL